MTAFKVTNLKQTDYLVVRQGFQSLLPARATDAVDNPIDLTDWTITVKVEFYEGIFTQGESDREGDSITIPDKTPLPNPVRDLTVVKDSDQTNNTGQYTWLIPDDLYTDDIPLASTNVPIGVVFHKYEFGTEKRTPVSFIVFYRGQP